GCLYLPNGNPAPGPKFDYKLRWFERLTQHAKDLLATGAPVVLAGDYNVMPTDLDVYKPERWIDDALFRPEVREASARAHLHLLGLLPERLGSECGAAHRSFAPQSATCAASERRMRRPRRAGL